jgi:hypothetical protein
MSAGPKGTEQDSIAQCSVCGHIEALFELPGRTEKCCLECSADLATAILLSTEIDAATLAGRSTNALALNFQRSAAGCWNGLNLRNWAMAEFFCAIIANWARLERSYCLNSFSVV